MKGKTSGKTRLFEVRENETIGDMARRLIAQTTLGNEQVARVVRAIVPGAQTSRESVAWYRSKMRRTAKNAKKAA